MTNRTDTATTSHIHLIRHGITTANVEGLIYGALDVPLADRGIAKLKELKEEGIYPSGEHADFYTSGMLRTEHTLELLYGKVPHAIMEDLQELNFGKLEGESIYDKDHQRLFSEWSVDDDIRFPGGESASRFVSRVMRGFNQVKGTHLNKVIAYRNQTEMADTIIVCHGGVIGAIMNELFPGHKKMWHWTPNPGHGYTLTYKEAKIIKYTEF